MQRIPTLYGFSIIILVFILMVLNHVIYLKILENAYAASDEDVAAFQMETAPHDQN